MPATNRTLRTRQRQMTLSVCAPLLLFAAAIMGCGRPEPIVIGFSGQQTGTYADLGISARNGALLAVEEINTSGGIHGRPLRLLDKDDGNTPEKAVQADRELLEAGAVAVIGHITSSQTMAALPQLEAAHVLLLSPTTSTPRLSGRIDTFFRVQATTQDQEKSLATMAMERFAIRTAAVAYTEENPDYVIPTLEGFAALFEGRGGRILLRLPLGSEQHGQAARHARRLLSAGADAIYLIASTADVVPIAQEIRRIAPDQLLMVAGLARTEALIREGGRSLEGTVMTTPDMPESIEYQAFQAKFEQRFGHRPLFSAVRGYEAALVLAEALRRGGDDRSAVLQAMRGLREYPGVDSVIRFDEFGDCQRASYLVEIRDGAFKLLR